MKMNTIRDIYVGGGASKHVPLNSDKMYLGIECEIESIYNYNKLQTTLWNPTNDGSLRNNGMEFISVPLSIDDAPTAFKNLHASLQFREKADAFSPRTSTHVHVNVLDFTPAQVRTFTLLYALFEECFFGMVDINRRHNIHCVPLTETYLPQLYHRNLDSLIHNWHKYTAFNLLPVAAQGTVEFRHLQGTDDVQLLQEWLGSINRLWRIAKAAVLNKETLTDVHINAWFDTIFGGTRMAFHKPSLAFLTRNTLVDVKLSTIGGLE